MWGVLFILLVIISIIIAYQDFNSRLINLWLILSWGILAVSLAIFDTSWCTFKINSLFTLSYLFTLACIIFLYTRIRFGKSEKIIGDKIGWGDVIVISMSCFCFEPQVLVFFFTCSMIISIGFYFLFFRGKTIPLAGLWCVFHATYLSIQHFF